MSAALPRELVQQRGQLVVHLASGWWRELLNTDATIYGGTGAGNLGGVGAQEIAWDNFHHSLELTLPPMSTLIFKWTREG